MEIHKNERGAPKLTVEQDGVLDDVCNSRHGAGGGGAKKKKTVLKAFEETINP